MRRKQIAMGALVIAAASVASQPRAAEGDAAAGREKTRMCAGCHGIDDFRIAYPRVYAVPRLGGQEAAYLANALNAFKAGTRKHAVMQGMAAPLTDQDIADIAAFYSAGAAK